MHCTQKKCKLAVRGLNDWIRFAYATREKAEVFTRQSYDIFDETLQGHFFRLKKDHKHG